MAANQQVMMCRKLGGLGLLLLIVVMPAGASTPVLAPPFLDAYAGADCGGLVLVGCSAVANANRDGAISMDLISHRRTAGYKVGGGGATGYARAHTVDSVTATPTLKYELTVFAEFAQARYSGPLGNLIPHVPFMGRANAALSISVDPLRCEACGIEVEGPTTIVDGSGLGPATRENETLEYIVSVTSSDGHEIPAGDVLIDVEIVSRASMGVLDAGDASIYLRAHIVTLKRLPVTSA